ncbi:hypothetical protein NECAME_03466, partial [Necator americanus]
MLVPDRRIDITFSGIRMWLGLGTALLTSIFYGCTFVPIKKVYAGDGFTSQLFACIGVFSMCMITSAVQGFPGFYPFAMLGGFLWAFGECDQPVDTLAPIFFCRDEVFSANAFAIQIINRIGMGPANLVWNTLSTLTGWATSRFGLLGLPAAIPASPTVNYLGVGVLIGGGAMYSLVKNNAQIRPGHEGDVELKEVHLNQADSPEGAKISKIEDISLIERM